MDEKTIGTDSEGVKFHKGVVGYFEISVLVGDSYHRGVCVFIVV